MRRSSAWPRRRNASRSSAPPPKAPDRSAPPQKMRSPAPVRTTARTPSSRRELVHGRLQLGDQLGRDRVRRGPVERDDRVPVARGRGAGSRRPSRASSSGRAGAPRAPEARSSAMAAGERSEHVPQHLVRVLAEVGRRPLDARRRAAELHGNPRQPDPPGRRMVHLHRHLPVPDLRVLEDLADVVDRPRREARLREPGHPVVAVSPPGGAPRSRAPAPPGTRPAWRSSRSAGRRPTPARPAPRRTPSTAARSRRRP